MSTSARIIAACLVLAAVGCSNLSPSAQRTLSGGAIGAGAGVAIGIVGGAPLLGALVGGGAGAAIGASTSEGQFTFLPSPPRPTPAPDPS